MYASYLNNNIWSNITRDERFFCYELYNCIKVNQKSFLKLLAESINPSSFLNNESLEQLNKLLETKTFDVGVEVCFYRDLIHYHQNIGKKKIEKWAGLSLKRTFDLALFCEETIIIIEAKAQQGFDNKQMDEFEADKRNLKIFFERLNLKKSPEIYLVALHSGKYNPKPKTKNNFDALFTWEKLIEIYPESKNIFLRANNIYGN
jgi:hypothetical protein